MTKSEFVKSTERLAKDLCNESGCHHKCNDTKDCVVEDEAELLISNNSQCIDCIHNEICQFYKAMGITVICYPCGFYKANAGYRKQSEWISVEDRLPEESGYYLIHQKLDLWFGEIIQTARWNKTERIFRGAQAGCFMEYVTHWMPLPEAPKMKGGEE